MTSQAGGDAVAGVNRSKSAVVKLSAWTNVNLGIVAMALQRTQNT